MSKLKEEEGGLHGSDRPTPKFDERTTVLLDDSPLKAIYQPWNQIVIPEFDKAGFAASKQVVSSHSTLDPDDEWMDKILLAVIGILERLKTVTSVPAWIRGGGLTLDEDIASSFKGMSVGDNKTGEPTLESLPSHEDFVHWFKARSVLEYWVGEGMKALQERGIEVDHGLDQNGSTRSSDHRRVGDGDSEPTQRNGWSPSRPSRDFTPNPQSPTAPGSPPRSAPRSPPSQPRRHFTSNAATTAP